MVQPQRETGAAPGITGTRPGRAFGYKHRAVIVQNKRRGQAKTENSCSKRCGDKALVLVTGKQGSGTYIWEGVWLPAN